MQRLCAFLHNFITYFSLSVQIREIIADATNTYVDDADNGCVGVVKTLSANKKTRIELSEAYEKLETFCKNDTSLLKPVRHKLTTILNIVLSRALGQLRNTKYLESQFAKPYESISQLAGKPVKFISHTPMSKFHVDRNDIGFADGRTTLFVVEKDHKCHTHAELLLSAQVALPNFVI